MSDTKQPHIESWHIDQITKSEFFHQKLHEYGLLEIAYAIENISGEELDWDLAQLTITPRAWKRIIHAGIKPIRVFAHPYILQTVDRSVGYYRGLAMVSLKSMNQVKLPIERFETGQNKKALASDKALSIAQHLNQLISRLIESEEKIDPREFDLWRGMTAGATAQGSWQNSKGDKAEKVIKGLVRKRLRATNTIAAESADGRTIDLTDGRTLSYNSEPDIAITKDEQVLATVEVKGGIDPAGVIERIGAAIKSLSRVKSEFPHARTILVMHHTALTEQARRELIAHNEVIEHWFTIEKLLTANQTRQKFFELLGL